MTDIAPEDPKTNLLLQQVALVYGAPNSEDPKGFLAIYAKMMRQYTDSELEEATSLLLRNRKYKTWPTIAECISACEDARGLIRTRLGAQANKARVQALEAARECKSTPEELEEGRRFVDEWAAGRRQLEVLPTAPEGHKLAMGLLSERLRKMAVQMRNKRWMEKGRL